MSWKLVATPPSASLSALSHSVCPLLVSVALQQFSRFTLSHHPSICFGGLWSVVFDVINTTVIVLGRHEPRWYKMAHLTKKHSCVLTAPPVCGSPISLPLLGAPYSPETQWSWTWPINNPAVGVVLLKVKVVQLCPTLDDPVDYIESMEFSRPEY